MPKQQTDNRIIDNLCTACVPSNTNILSGIRRSRNFHKVFKGKTKKLDLLVLEFRAVPAEEVARVFSVYWNDEFWQYVVKNF